MRSFRMAESFGRDLEVYLEVSGSVCQLPFESAGIAYPPLGIVHEAEQDRAGLVGGVPCDIFLQFLNDLPGASADIRLLDNNGELALLEKEH